MATIRERSNAGGENAFHVQVRMSGFPSRTASFQTRRQAERWAKTVEADMIEGRHFRNVEARRRTLAEAIDRYLAEEVPKKRDGKMHRANLPWWRKKLGHLKLANVTPAVLSEYLGKLSRETYTRAKPESKNSIVEPDKQRHFVRSASTINRYHAVLEHVFTVARREWHWAQHNPFDGVSKRKESGGRVRFLNSDERTALLKATARDPQLHTFTVLALATAARAGELVNLVWRDTDVKAGQLLFRVTKNAEPRTAWVQGEALRLLKEHGKVRRLDDDRVFASPTGRQYRYEKAFGKACKTAGLSGCRFHDLRHSAATYLAREGATEQQLRAIGGWKSNVVARYVHIAAEDSKEIVAKMNKKILAKVP